MTTFVLSIQMLFVSGLMIHGLAGALAYSDQMMASEVENFHTGGLSRKSFPEGFVFGAATSAYQVEGTAQIGSRGMLIWNAFIKMNQEDIDILKKMHIGFRSHGPEFSQANSNWIYEVPWGMYKSLNYLKDHYRNLPLIVSENGVDDPGNVTFHNGLSDSDWIHYYREYLQQMKKAIDEGANVTGYFAWSLVDNFEWLMGYT